MSINAPSLFTQKFASNVALLSQQRMSKLEGTVTTGSY